MPKTILSQITPEWRLFSLHFSFDGTEVAKYYNYDHSHFYKTKIWSSDNLSLRRKHCLFVDQNSAKRKITRLTHLKTCPIQSGNTGLACYQKLILLHPMLVNY